MIMTSFGGRDYARLGHRLKIDVPVCEAWRVELSVTERIRVGPQLRNGPSAFGFNYTKTNVWRSPELPGWSQIRKAFRSEVKEAELTEH